MTATTLDMRYRTHDLFESLSRGIEIVITYRGKKAGILSPYRETSSECPVHVVDHPFFGSASDETASVNAIIDRNRQSRHVACGAVRAFARHAFGRCDHCSDRH